jgi:hypothetical protein
VRSLSFLPVVSALFLSTAAEAQTPEVPQPSPKARVDQRVGVTDFSIEYSSPGVKGRKIWGEVVKYDEPWRTGANAATKLTVSRDFTFGDKTVPAGSYSVFTIPTKASWTVILNSDVAASPSSYDTKKDVARLTVKPASVALRERLGFFFVDTTDESTRIDLEWEKLRISVPVKVDTNTFVAAAIDKSLSEAWRPHFVAARHLLESNGDLDKALGYVDSSIGIQPTWWNNWVKGQILAKKGKGADAVAAAEKAMELGKGDTVFENFFKAEVTKQIGDWKKKF